MRKLTPVQVEVLSEMVRPNGEPAAPNPLSRYRRATLDRLVKCGLLSVTRPEATTWAAANRPRPRVYSVTASGLQTVARHRADRAAAHDRLVNPDRTPDGPTTTIRPGKARRHTRGDKP